MAFIRKVRTTSGATAVQIAEYAGGRQRIVKHVGSAHTEAELGLLIEQAMALLEDPGQGRLDLAVEPSTPVASLLESPDGNALLATGKPLSRVGRDSPGRVVGTDSKVLFDALAGVYADLAFDVVADAVFQDLVISRIVEPTSLLDTARVLTDLGRDPASYTTMRRTLTRAQQRSYRDQIAAACFKRASSSGDVSLILYDVTSLLCRRRHNNVYADLLVMPMFGVSAQVRAALGAGKVGITATLELQGVCLLGGGRHVAGDARCGSWSAGGGDGEPLGLAGSRAVLTDDGSPGAGRGARAECLDGRSRRCAQGAQS